MLSSIGAALSCIAKRLPITLKLGGIALAIAVFVAIPLGVLAALYRDSWIDRLALLIAGEPPAAQPSRLWRHEHDR